MPQTNEKKLYDPIYYQKKAEFSQLLRMIGTSVEGHRDVIFGLSTIRGVGRRLAQAICSEYLL